MLDRPPAIPWRQPRGYDAAGDLRRARATWPPEPASAPRLGEGWPEVLAEGAGKALSGRGSTGARPPPLPAGEPIMARPVGQVERALKWARRRPALAALSASACWRLSCC